MVFTKSRQNIDIFPHIHAVYLIGETTKPPEGEELETKARYGEGYKKKGKRLKGKRAGAQKEELRKAGSSSSKRSDGIDLSVAA